MDTLDTILALTGVNLNEQNLGTIFPTTGKVGMALVSLGTQEAIDRHKTLIELARATKSAIETADQFDGRIGPRTSAQLIKMMETVCDGVVMSVALSDPSRVRRLPVKTGLEAADPTVYVQELLNILREGDALEQKLGHGLEQVFKSYETHQKQVKEQQARHEEADKAVVTTRLSLQSYVADCKKYIAEVAPKGHAAHQHLKRNPPRKKSETTQEQAPKNANVEATKA
jgi:hypothetical protein